MSTTRIKEKISTLVSSQLPEFIQSEYTTFIAFLEAYYEFIEQDQGAQELLQNIRSYNDIDRTIDSFIEYFIKQYCNDIPREVLYNKKALVKNINDLYENRGNEKSYKLLFQILYNKDVEIFYPYNQVLKASDGKWVQEYSFFMKTIVGDGSTIIGKPCFITSSSTKYQIYLKKRKQAYSSSGASDIVYEYYFDNSKNVPVNIGDVIEKDGFKGEIVGIPISASVIDPGAGFRVGDILTPAAGLGDKAKIKITKVNSTGGILNVEFINFGIGYSGDFYNFFFPYKALPAKSSFTFEGNAVTISEITSGFSEKGTITKPSYSTSYFAEDYDGTVLREFYFDTSSGSLSSIERSQGGTVSSLIQPKTSTIFFRIGSKTKYPGYYESIDGFLSDNIYIEDQDYYQPFSYVLKIDERLSQYKKAVLDILHPAGTKLFGDLTLTASIDIGAEISEVIRILLANFQDQFSQTDSNSKHVYKNLSNNITTSEFVSKDINKPFSDIVDNILAEISSKNIGKSLSDSSNTSDSTNKSFTKVIGLGESLPYASSNYFASDYTEIGGENLIEFVDSFDYVSGYLIDLADTQSQNDTSNSSISVYKYSNINQILDSGSIFFSDYAESYFSENYVGVVIQTF